jgi:hypothetical protein
MPGLIKSDLASARQLDSGDRAPPLILNWRAPDTLLFERSHLRLQIVAHEIEFMSTILVGWVYGGFGRRKRKDQPSMTGIHGVESEHVAEKCTIRLGVFAVDNYVSAENHSTLQNKLEDSRRS